MAISNVTGNPIRFGQGQTADDRALFLKTFGGEVLTSWTAQCITRGKTFERNIASGKSAAFPRTGTSQAEYHTPGTELMGNAFATGEVEISLDGLLVAHHDLYDLDTAMSHFDVRGPIAEDMGGALARAYDKNVFRTVALAARTAASGPFPGGQVVTNAALSASSPDGKAWIDQLRATKIALQRKNIPASLTKYVVVDPAILDAIKYATNTQGQYVLLNRDYGAVGGSISNTVEQITIEGFTIMSSNLLPSTNESADTSVWSKYRADYSKTVGLLWIPQAVGTLTLLGVSMETERSARRQSDFMVSKMAVGHGPLRSEGAVEFRTA